LNEGSKVVLAAAGPPRRSLSAEVPDHLSLPDGFSRPRVCLPGVLAVQGPRYQATAADGAAGDPAVERLCQSLGPADALDGWPLVVVVDDSEFTGRTLNNFLWITFTRSNPAADVYGVGAFTRQKHWGCMGPLVIDARIKPQHAPPLEEDPQVSKRVDALAAAGGPLHGII
jgi:4-hydroxy-3-polyprenylbenzoate decarboxylase